AADIAFGLEDIEDAAAHRGGRRHDGVAAAQLRVADPGQHVPDRISKGHGVLSLPARLHEARDLPEIAQLAQRDAAHPELAVVAARAARNLAPVAHARRRGIAGQRRELESRREALLERHALVLDDILEPEALAAEALGQLLAPVV